MVGEKAAAAPDSAVRPAEAAPACFADAEKGKFAAQKMGDPAKQ